MGILSQTFGDKLNNFQTASSSSSPIQVTTTSGKQYTLDGNQVNWIKSRYKQDGADTYGWDDADQYAKQTGQLSAKMRSTYKNSNVDRQLAEMGLPSEKNLEKYIADYQNWHTGGISDYFGKDTPQDFYTKTKEMFKGDWQYDDTQEDQLRKSSGQMPSKLASKYTDTEIDDDLRAAGLPPVAEMGKYIGRYNNYSAIDNLYKNAAVAWANLGLSQDDNGQYIQNDNKLYTVNGLTRKGKDLYADAFYDEMGRKDANGNDVYGSIYALFKNNHLEEDPDDYDGTNYNQYRGKQFANAAKVADLADDYAAYTAFSYDDFAGKYGDYYDKFLKNYKFSNGQTLEQIMNGIALKKDEQQQQEFYDVSDKWLDKGRGTSDFVARYKQMYPSNTYEQMFTDMFENGVAESTIAKTMRTLRRDTSVTGGKNNAEDKNSGFNDITDAFYRAKQNFKSEQRVNEEAIAAEAEELTTEDAVRRIEDYMSESGGWTAENATKAMDALVEAGVDAGTIKDAVADMRARFGDSEYKDAMDALGAYELKETGAEAFDEFTVKKYQKELRAAQRDARKQYAEDEATIQTAYDAIDKMLTNLITTDEGVASVNDVIAVLDSIESASWNNPVSMEKALERYGFVGNGQFTGLAEKLTKNWSNDDKLKLFYNIGSVRTADVDPENNDFIEKFTDIFGGDWLKFNEAPVTKRSMQYADFASALDWAKEQIANGTLTEAQAYQVLSAEGYSPELEQYVGEDWHRAVYEDLHVPMMFQQAGGAQLATWEEMTPDERKKVASDMYDSLSAEEKAAMFGDADWWKSDPTVYRTFGQAFEQQFAAILPGLATDLIASGAELGDMIGASFTGRPELNDSTKDWLKMQAFVQNYGSVYDDVNGTKVADVAASVVGEIARMQVLGMVGAGVGSAFEATGIGGKLAKLAAGNPGIVKKATGMALSLVRSSPFVANAWAHDYAELKSLGASNSEAMWNSMITGVAEGVLEGFNFDNLWGKVLGQEAFATEILDAGKRAFGTAGIVWKARIANMAASGLGEFTEESIGYVLDTYLKMRHSDTWGKGTEWSAEDWLAQAGMGFLVGAIGGGMASMDINASRILSEYAMSSEEGLRAVFPDVFVSDGVWGTANETVKASYRTGGATVLSDAAYKTLREQAEACVASAQKTLEAARADEADAQEKINNAESEVRKLEDKLAPYMLVKGRKESLTGEEAEEFGALYAKWNEAKRHAESVRNEVSKDLAEKAGNHERSLQNAESQLKDLQKKIQEHFCGIHLMNEGATPEQAFENMMNAYQNGFKVEGKAAQVVDTKTENAPETNATTETTKDEASVAAREAAYDRVYTDQEAGKAYGNETKNAKGRKLTRVEFAENERQNFQAKTTAKQGKVTLELAGLEAAEGMSDKEIIAEAKKAMTPDAAKKLDMFMKLSKALGMPMVIRDVVAGTSGYVHDGKLYVTLNGKQALLRVTAHEVTHWMKEHLPSGYDVLRTRLINDVGGQEAFDELVQKKAQEYSLDLSTDKGRLEADDEVCAELCEKMFENKDALEKFVNEATEAAKTLKARLAKTLVTIKQAIKSLGTSSSETSADLIKDQDTIELWYKTLSDAIDAANAEAKGKVQPTIEDVATETETSTEAQPQAPPEADLWSKSYKEWGEADGNSAYAVYLALKEVNPEMAKAYEDGGDGGPQDVLNAVINIANDVRQEQISPMAAATILSNQYNADKSSLGSLFNGAGNATEGVLNAARQIDEERNGAITDLGISAEEVRKQNLRSELEELAKKGTKVKDFDRASVNEILDRVIVGDRTNYSKADYAQIRGMLAQLIPEIKAMVDGDTSVDLDALNERVQTALNYMLDRYSEPSAELYDLREIIPGKIALTETAYNELRKNSQMTLREASNRMTRALGKFVNFVYKGSPNYSAASTIDEVWRDIGYEPEGQGTIAEDADALIKYVEERAERSSYDDLYKSQRDDLVSAHAGEFLDAVQSIVEGKAAETAALHSIDDDYMPLAERYDAGIATDEDVDELQSEVDDAARVNGYTIKAYHGTTDDFTEFKRGEQGRNHDGYLEFGAGFYFTPSEKEARQWVERGRSGIYGKAEPRVMSVYLNPNRIIGADDVVPGGINYLRGIGLSVAEANFVANRAYRFINYLIEDRGFSNVEAQETMKALGFDAIDATLGNGTSGQYVVFDPEQIKSADLVTYDNDNNIIPLSERFDPNKTDIRWSVDDDWDELIKRYGAIEQGREPRARDVVLPKQVDDNRYVSKLTRTVAESSQVTDEYASEIVQDALKGSTDYTYLRKSNDETMKRARDYIAQRGLTAAQQDFHDRVTAGKFNAETNALGIQLFVEAHERGDVEAQKAIVPDLRTATTEEGQAIQIINVLKELKGVGSAWYIESLIDKLNVMYANEIQSGQMDPITVSEEAMQKVRDAKTQAEVDAAEGAVADEIGPQLPLKRDEKLSNWRYLSMLGNPTTHIRNVTGNALMFRMGGMKDIVAAGVQRLLENTDLVDESDRAHALLTPSDKAYWDGFAEQSYQDMKSALQGGGKLGFQSLAQSKKRSFDNKILDTIARGKNPGKISEAKGFKGLWENIKNNGAMGMLEVEDGWGLRKNYKRALMEYMKAQGYSLNNDGQVGKVGTDGTFTEISKEQMDKAIEWASGQAWTNTFRGPSKLATELNKISKMNTVSKFVVEGVMPFKKTPINIAKTGAMFSPAGIIVGTTELLTKVKQGKMSAATAVDHLSSGLTGTALMALGVVLAKAGILRGGGEDKKKYETYLEDTGDQTYAFKFGNASINMSAIAPATIPLFMGVALQEMLSRNGEDEGVDLSTITDVLAGTLNPFMEMSFMASLNSALKNYNSNGIGGALGGTIMTAAQNYGSQYLPTLGGKIAQFADPTLRSTKSSATSPVGGNMDYYARSLAKKVPGLEATLQPDVNVWGQTTTKDTFSEWALDFANKFILPTNIKVTNRDAVDRELIRVVESTGVTDFLPSDGNKYFTVKGQKYSMNARQYAEYSQERGQAAYAALKDVMASPAYVNASDETKADMLNKAKEVAYKAVNNVWKDKLGAFNN